VQQFPVGEGRGKEIRGGRGTSPDPGVSKEELVLQPRRYKVQIVSEANVPFIGSESPSIPVGEHLRVQPGF
jgi:hypothetical protein